MLKINRKSLIKYSLSTLTVSALAVAGFFVWQAKTTQASWWNDAWQYRQAIEVNNNASEQTNIYITLTLNTDTASTSMQTDCGDFRFVTEAGKVLEYYIESGCRSTTTVIYLAYDRLPAGQQTVYFYYANPSAANGFSAGITGAVTQANMRLSVASSTAFVDFSNANTLTSYLGQKLVITDPAGKKLTGYIKSAGTGETYASELVANPGFEGTYSSGFAPNWERYTTGAGSGVGSEENADVHGGASAQKLVTVSEAGGTFVRIPDADGFMATSGALYKYEFWYKVLSNNLSGSTFLQHDSSKTIIVAENLTATAWT